MSEVLTQLRDFGDGYQTVFVRCDTTGTVSIRQGSTEIGTGVVDTAVDDGTAAITCAVSAWGWADVYLDDVFSHTIRLKPLEGKTTYRVGFGTCFNDFHSWVQGYFVSSLDLDAFVCAGDWIYCDVASAPNRWGETHTPFSLDQSAGNLRARYRQMLRNTGKQHAFNHTPILFQQDDHEYPGGGWDHTVAPCNFTNTYVANYDYAAVKASWDTCRDVADEYFFRGNPVNSDALAIDEAPAIMANDHPDSDFPVRYWRKRFGNTLEIFVPDLTTHKDSINGRWFTFTNGDQNAGAVPVPQDQGTLGGVTAAVVKIVTESGDWGAGTAAGYVGFCDETSGFLPGSGAMTMAGGATLTLAGKTNEPAWGIVTDNPEAPTVLGAQQIEWLLAQLEASPCKYKVILSPKHWLSEGNSADDDLMRYPNERDALLAEFTARGITPVIVSGDRHNAGAYVHQGDPDTFLEVGAGACGHGYHSESWDNTTRWGIWGDRWGVWGSKPPDSTAYYGHFAVIEASPAGLGIRVYDYRNQVAWETTIPAGHSGLTYPAKAIAVG